MRCLVTILVLLLLSAGVFLSGSHAAQCNAIILHYSVTNFNRAGIPTLTFSTRIVTSIYTNTKATFAAQTGMADYIWTIPGVLNSDFTIILGGTNSKSNNVTVMFLPQKHATLLLDHVPIFLKSINNN